MPFALAGHLLPNECPGRDAAEPLFINPRGCWPIFLASCTCHPHHRFAFHRWGSSRDARLGCLVINTFHTFPASVQLLKTQTLIEGV